MSAMVFFLSKKKTLNFSIEKAQKYEYERNKCSAKNFFLQCIYCQTGKSRFLIFGLLQNALLQAMILTHHSSCYWFMESKTR